MNVLVLGASGQIARFAIDLFLNKTDANLTLYLRQASRINGLRDRSKRLRVVEGDVLDLKSLESTMPGHDIVYANLDGQLEAQAKNVVTAMKHAGIRRLLWVSSMGIYTEVPGQNYRSVLDPYRDSAAVIEVSGLDYTLIRPAWLNDNDEIDYETTQKGEPFRNAGESVSRKSVADLIVRLAENPDMGNRSSLGVNKKEARP